MPCNLLEMKIHHYSFGSPMPGRKFNSSNYKYGFNGQEKDDEISGSGNSNTAEFWEYDTRLGRRWNVDPKMNLWEGSYVTFGDNPITNVDANGDEWGKPGDAKSKKEDKAAADDMKNKFKVKEAVYQSDLENANKDLANFNGDTKSKEYKVIEERVLNAKGGVLDMQNAQNELDEMETSQNYFTFQKQNGSSGVDLHPKIEYIENNKFVYTIPYASGAGVEFGTKAHETKHAHNFLSGWLNPNDESKRNLFLDKATNERLAYRRQYFVDKYSLPMPLLNVKNWKEINKENIQKIIGVNGQPLYDFSK